MGFFDDARLKVERAGKHIAELNDALGSLKDNYTATVEKDAGTGHQKLIHTCPELEDAFKDLALIIGDAIHNLRTALEFAWIAILEKQKIPYDPKHVSFPIRDTPRDLEAALGGMALKTACPKLYDEMVKGIQPYKEGKGVALWTIHSFDVSDKHLLLLELGRLADVTGVILQKPDGEIVRAFSGAIESAGPYIISFDGSIRIREKGKLTVNVLVKEAGEFSNVHVADLLRYFRGCARFTLERLEAL